MLGLAVVGIDAVKHANHCVSYTTTVQLFLLSVTIMVIELDHIVRGGEL